ncbi:MAG: ribonuclease Z [Clostridia bacterium]|nr:ribonuclease Z [Clostridia bacterium]
MFDITLLGCAALLPLPERALTAAALSCAGHTVLFDCGEGTQSAARKAHVNVIGVDLIALTHYHGDHIFGLPGLLQTMFSMNRTQPLVIAGPAGIAAELAPVVRLAGWLSFDLKLVELPPEGVQLCALCPGWPPEARLTAFPTVHRVPSQGYAVTLSRAGRFLPERAKALGVPLNQWSALQHGACVEADGRLVRPEDVLGAPRRGLKFVFSGDTAPCPSLEEAARDADLFICEATYGENEQEALAADHGHMTFAQAAAIAARANVRRLWLTHYSQMIKDPAEYLDNARTFFPDAVCGEDGLRADLRFDEA